MRLFSALGVCFVVGVVVVGVGASFHPSSGLPGREAGASEASQVVGGACGAIQATNCDSDCAIGKATVQSKASNYYDNSGCCGANSDCQTIAVTTPGCG